MSTVAEVIERGAKMSRQAEQLGEARDLIEPIMNDYPEEGHGSAWLEQAIELIERAEDEIDCVTEKYVEENLPT